MTITELDHTVLAGTGPANPPARTTAVCRVPDLVPERGVAALVGGAQVAIFRIPDPEGDRVLAVDHHDPFSGANVLARGIVGTVGDRWYVASPVYKQRFELETGRCIDAEGVAVGTWTVEVVDDEVHIRHR